MQASTEAAPAPATAPAAVATIEIPQAAPPPPEPEPEPAEPVDPVPIGRRIGTATRVGAWAGAVLGFVSFLIATAGWAASATLTGEGPYNPVIQTEPNSVIIGVALVGVVFGAIVAGLSRASAGWTNPGMKLSNSPRSTAWLGAVIGLLLGVIAGAILTSGFGTPLEGDEGLVQLPVLATLAVMLIGGAVLGAATAAVTQAVAVPVAVEDDDRDEVHQVRKRLGGALSVPVAGLVLLLLLVLPFAWTLIQTNHLTSGGAAIVAIIAAAGILAFASLAGNRPNMKISFGEMMVAIVGIGTVIVVVVAVLLAQSPAEEHEEPANGGETAIVQIYL